VQKQLFFNGTDRQFSPKAFVSRFFIAEIVPSTANPLFNPHFFLAWYQQMGPKSRFIPSIGVQSNCFQSSDALLNIFLLNEFFKYKKPALGAGFF